MAINKEYLQREYVENNRPIKEVAEECGVDIHEVRRWLDVYGLPKKDGRPAKLLTKEVLLDLYVKQEKSCKEIAKMLNLRTHTSVVMALKRHGIEIKPSGWKSLNCKLKVVERSYKGCGDLSGSYWCSVRHCAKNRGIDLSITIEHAWNLFLEQKGICALSGRPIYLAKSRWEYLNGKKEHTASLDRKDSSLGYEVGNVQWIHKDYQLMKMDMPQDKFIQACIEVAKFNKGV